VLQAVGQEVEGASQSGPVVQSWDLTELLSAIAVLLGRSRPARPDPSGYAGPVLLWAGAVLSDPESKEAACVVAVLLSTLVAHQKQLARTRLRCDEEENKEGAGGCPQLVAARSFATLEQLGLLPDPDVFDHQVRFLGPGCLCISSLGDARVGEEFRELVERSRRINDTESRAALDGSAPPSGSLKRGDRVYTLVSGVTEILDIQWGDRGEKVVVVMVGEPHPDPSARKTVSLSHVRPTGMRRSY
jgi:hypothetical protein